jgi:hypothetical protein
MGEVLVGQALERTAMIQFTVGQARIVGAPFAGHIEATAKGFVPRFEP